MQKHGEAGLAALGEQLEQAIKANDVYAPSEVITSVPVPPVDSIQAHTVATIRSGDASPHPSLAKLQPSIDALPVLCQVPLNQKKKKKKKKRKKKKGKKRGKARPSISLL